MQSRTFRLLALAMGSLPAYAAAVPPPGAALSAVSMPRASWIEHRIVPGDRVNEIASHYGVTIEKLLAWNELDEKRPLLRVGKQLHIYTAVKPWVRRMRHYTVQRGDTWPRIATRFEVDKVKLRNEWNPTHDKLEAGDRIELWVETEDEPAPEAAEPAEQDEPQMLASNAMVVLPSPVRVTAQRGDPPAIVSVPTTALSSGSPARGRLLHGLQLPENPALYKLRNPDNSWGSSHTIEQLQRAIARFRQDSGFARELVIEDMSLHYGGRFQPHRSHRSGRDVDVELPLKPGIAAGTVPTEARMVDWGATWSLVKALIETGQVRYIFLTRSRQKDLYEAAVRAGASEEELTAYLQYPHSERTTFVRHAHGHTKHMHVRFACAEYEAQCRD